MTDLSPRRAASNEVFERLFGRTPTTDGDPHPEFGEILRGVIFGDVFATGDLDDRTRELVTCTAIATLQALPQLKAHAMAALGTGVTPVELTEAMYQLAPFIGFPRTLNALGVVTEVFQDKGIDLPLEQQGTVTDETRHEAGAAIRQRIYGPEVADALTHLPAPYDVAVPDFLTDFRYGDFWTRGGLDVATRELLGLVTLTALGSTPQLAPHVRSALTAGNSPERVLAALVQAFPYVGYPAALDAIRVVAEVLSDD